MAPGKRWLKIEDGTVWADPRGASDLEWTCRHAPDTLTREDLLVIAAALTCYYEITTRPEFRGKPAMIRRAMGRIL